MADSDPAACAFTVVTPTFDRAHTLPRVYDGLRAQTLDDFEWVVVDDGSTDGTRELVAGWTAESPFPIRYFRQENLGKHRAERVGVEQARGRFVATLDSDDLYRPEALETFLATWDSIPAAERETFVGVVGLCADVSGAVIGSPFPADVFDTTYTDLPLRYGVTGDKAGCGRADVVRSFELPDIPGERLALEQLLYARIARRYRIRCVNKVLMVKDYQATGLSAATRSNFVQNPRTAKLFFLEQLDLPGVPLRHVLRSHANHTRYALHARLLATAARDSPSKLLWLATLPFGALAYARDRWRRRG